MTRPIFWATSAAALLPALSWCFLPLASTQLTHQTPEPGGFSTIETWLFVAMIEAGTYLRMPCGAFFPYPYSIPSRIRLLGNQQAFTCPVTAAGSDGRRNTI
jgi:hypothetical protein